MAGFLAAAVLLGGCVVAVDAAAPETAREQCERDYEQYYDYRNDPTRDMGVDAYCESRT